MKASAYRNYLLAILMVILAFNYVDRLALAVVLQNIKVDLSLSDTQLGLLSGIAFALFYSVMGLPIARWADRGNRIVIITVTTLLWSVAVALCGFAASFVQLLLIRVAVAVGEAGCIPPAHSLIADYFTREERPRAVARYMQGGPLSVVIGYCLAGWLSELFGWRAMFVMLGLPGLVLVALARFTLKEPRSSVVPEERTIAATAGGQPTLREVTATLWSNKSFRHLLFCISIVYFFTQGIGQWQPAFFMRSYGIGAGELGTWFTVIWGLGGLIGTYLGGEWAFRRAAGNERLQLRVMGIAYGVFGLISLGVYLSPNRYLALGLLGLASIGVNTTSGPLFATIQSLVPARMRALSIALIYLFANLIGMGLGPLAAGALSDAYRPWAGDESLRYALLTLCPGYLWATWHLWRGSRTVSRDLSLFKESSHAIETRYPAKPAVSPERDTVHST